MGIIMPVLFIAGIAGVIFFIATLGGTNVGSVESACSDLLEAVQKKDRVAIARYASISDPGAAERMTEFAHSYELVRYDIRSSRESGEMSYVEVHVVINPARDSMMGKNTDQKSTTLTVRFRWSSGRWQLAGHEIN